MDNCQDAQVIQSLKKILNGPFGEEKRLKFLKEIEFHHRNGTKLTILSHLIKMVPLTQSLLSLQRLMLLFLGRVMELLREMEILEQKEMAEETLLLIKQFWSLCSNQQMVVAPIKTHGKWSPILLEIVTSLASVYIDLFVTSYEQAKDQTLWSNRLYSWLRFDLNQRAIKTAFLEVTCPINKASKLLSPILSKIIDSPLDAMSNMDYLLHLLLLKKWSEICNKADIETSRNIKAPKKFISWLSEQWRDSQGYIPQDKNLKGRRVTQFILDLDDDAIESLTDVFSHCLKRECDMVDMTASTNLEEERATTALFVVDKKGRGYNTQDSEMSPEPLASSSAREPIEEAPGSSFIVDTKGSEVVMQVSDSEDEVQFVKKSDDGKRKKQKRKQETAERSSFLLDPTEELNYYIIPDRTSETNSSEKRKKQKLWTKNEEISDAMIIDRNKRSKQRHDRDIGHEVVEILNDEGGKRRDDDSDNPLGLDVIDFESLSELAENTAAGTSSPSLNKQRAKSTPRQNGYTSNNDTALKSDHNVSKDTVEQNKNEEIIELDTGSQNIDIGGSDIIEIVVEASQNRKGKKNQSQAKSHRSKPLILSDPVSSYFTPQKEAENIDKMQIYDLTEDSGEDCKILHKKDSVEKEISHENFARTSKPQKTLKHRSRSSDKGIVNHGSCKDKQTFLTIIDDSVKENEGENEHNRSARTLSEADKSGSDATSSDKWLPSNTIIIPEDSSDGEITFKDMNVNVTVPSLEEDISRQLSSIRREGSKTCEFQVHSEISRSITPSRRSTRFRTRSEGEDSISNVDHRMQHQVMSEKKMRKEKTCMKTVASTSILKDWLRLTPRNSPSQVSKSLTSPLKFAKKDFTAQSVIDEQSPKASTTNEVKKQDVKLPVKNKVLSVFSNKEKRQPLTRSDIFPNTYSRIKQKTRSEQKPSSTSKKAPLSLTSSLKEDKNISIDTKSYNLRTSWKSNLSKSPGNKISLERKRSFTSPETGHSDAEFQTSPSKTPQHKLNKSLSSDKESTSTSMTTKCKKTPQSSTKLTPKTSPANRRKSLRSAGKKDKGKGTV